MMEAVLPEDSQSVTPSRSQTSSQTGFYDDDQKCTFGLRKRGGEEIPYSDFNFRLKSKVIASQGSTGYLAEVSTEKIDGENQSRTCYFTTKSTMSTPDFMGMINYAFPEGGLSCSFNNTQLNQFYQLKKRGAGALPSLTAVSKVGLQDDNQTWVLGPDTILDNDGMPESSSKYIWIGHLHTGPSIANRDNACTIWKPLDRSSLLAMIDQLEVVMDHNFFPALLVLGSTAMALHYTTILAKCLYCPVPLVFGGPGTGKSTALRCGLSMLGCMKRMFSKGTKEKYASLCSSTTLPLVIDDPRSQSTISDLVISLYNGAYEGTVARGQDCPTSMAVIGANFTTSEKEQYISRCVLIEFLQPHLDISIEDYADLPEIMKRASAAVGAIIQCGNHFVQNGIHAIQNQYVPIVKETLGGQALPRVVPSYAMLLWFTTEVITAACADQDRLSNLKSGLISHFQNHCAKTILKMQKLSTSVVNTGSISEASDSLAEELLSSCRGLTVHQVWRFMRTDNSDVMVRIDDIPTDTPHSLKLAIKSTTGARGSKRDFLTILPTSDEEAASWKKVMRNKNAEQKRCTLIPLGSFSKNNQRHLVEVTTHPALKQVTSTVTSQSIDNSSKQSNADVESVDEADGLNALADPSFEKSNADVESVDEADGLNALADPSSKQSNADVESVDEADGLNALAEPSSKQSDPGIDEADGALIDPSTVQSVHRDTSGDVLDTVPSCVPLKRKKRKTDCLEDGLSRLYKPSSTKRRK